MSAAALPVTVSTRVKLNRAAGRFARAMSSTVNLAIALATSFGSRLSLVFGRFEALKRWIVGSVIGGPGVGSDVVRARLILCACASALVARV